MAANLKNSSGVLEYPRPIPEVGYPKVHAHETAGENPRVIVLVPNTDIDVAQLKVQITRLGITRSQEIVLLGKAARWTTDQRPNALFRLAIDLRPTGMTVTHKMIREQDDWISGIKYAAEPTDIVICHAEYQGQKLRDTISSQLGLTSYVVSGLYKTPLQRLQRLVLRGIFEVLPLALIIATFWLQVQISTQTHGLLNSVLLALTVLVEVAVLFGWSLLIKSGSDR